jgi:hypothetical protein
LLNILFRISSGVVIPIISPIASRASLNSTDRNSGEVLFVTAVRKALIDERAFSRACTCLIFVTASALFSI